MARVQRVEPEQIKPRTRFRMLLERMTQEHPEMSAGQLADYAAATLPEEDREFVQSFLRSEARTILAFELRIQQSRGRHNIMAAVAIHDPEAPAIAELSERRQDTLYQRIEEWREFVPSRRGSYTLLSMTRSSLLDSANEDLRRGFTYAYKGLFKKKLADRLTDDTQTVGDVYSDDEILEILETSKKEMSRGTFRIKPSALRPLQGRNSLP